MKMAAYAKGEQAARAISRDLWREFKRNHSEYIVMAETHGFTCEKPPSFEQKMNKDYLSGEEKAHGLNANKAWGATRTRRLQAWDFFDEPYRTYYKNIVRKIDYEDERLWGELIDDKITIGKMASEVERLCMGASTRYAELGHLINTALTESHNRELQAFNESMDRWYQSEMIRNALDTPFYTSCSVFGNTVHCSSY